MIHSNCSNIMSSFVKIAYDMFSCSIDPDFIFFRGVKFLPQFSPNIQPSRIKFEERIKTCPCYIFVEVQNFATRWFQLSVYWWFLGYIFVLKRFIALFDILMQLKSLHRHLTNFLFYRYKTINFHSPELFKYYATFIETNLANH